MIKHFMLSGRNDGNLQPLSIDADRQHNALRSDCKSILPCFSQPCNLRLRPKGPDTATPAWSADRSADPSPATRTSQESKGGAPKRSSKRTSILKEGRYTRGQPDGLREAIWCPQREQPAIPVPGPQGALWGNSGGPPDVSQCSEIYIRFLKTPKGLQDEPPGEPPRNSQQYYSLFKVRTNQKIIGESLKGKHSDMLNSLLPRFQQEVLVSHRHFLVTDQVHPIYNDMT